MEGADSAAAMFELTDLRLRGAARLSEEPDIVCEATCEARRGGRRRGGAGTAAQRLSGRWTS